MTLLEVVLAVTLAVGLMGALLGFYRHADALRATLIRQAEASTAQRLIMERITEELRCAVVYRFLNVGLEGAGDKITLVTAKVPGRGAWSEREEGSAALLPEKDLQEVTYGLRVTEDDQGGRVVEGLQRACRKVPASIDTREAAGQDEALLSSRVKFLHFRYWDGGTWLGTWGGGDLPAMVEVTLGPEPLPEGVSPEDYPYSAARRLVYVPGGRRAVEGGVIRRRGGVP